MSIWEGHTTYRCVLLFSLFKKTYTHALGSVFCLTLKLKMYMKVSYLNLSQ